MLAFGLFYSVIFKKIFVNVYIQIIGVISYSLYLWHYYIILKTDEFAPSFINNNYVLFFLNLIIAGSVSFLISFLSYKYIEKPFLVGKAKQVLAKS